MKVWLSKKLLRILAKEVEEKFPKETGGILVGYISNSDYVITHIIGPGPQAVHTADKFIPDHDFQCEEIAKHYKHTEGSETYLGDWHSHPNAPAYLSNQDKSTFRKIAQFKEAKISKPIMMILGTEPQEIKCWRYVHRYRFQIQEVICY